MFKKLLAILLVLAVLFSLTACSDSKKGGADAKDNASAAEKDGVSGLWKSEAKIKVKDIMIASTEVEGVPEDVRDILNVFPQIESDAELDVYIEFKKDNSYEIKYKLDDFKSGLKEYYKKVYELFKADRPLFEEVFNLNFVVIETMMINSTLNSYEDIVDSYEQKNANRIDELSDSEVLSYAAPALTGNDVKDGYVVVKGYNYEFKGNNLKIELDGTGETSVNLTLKDKKLTFSNASESVSADVFKNGLERVK